MRTYKAYTGTLLLKTIFVLSALCVSASSEAANLVSVTSVETWNKGLTHQLWCQVSTPNLYKISSHGNAHLDWVKPVGSFVNKSDMVAQQKNFYLENEIKILGFDISTAELTLAFEDKEYKRISTLQNNLISASQLETQLNKVHKAELALKRMQQELSVARYRLEHFNHQSVIDGQIIEVFAEPGQMVAEGQLIATIQPTRGKELKCELPVDVYKQFSGIHGLKKAEYQSSDQVKFNYLRGNQIFDQHKQVVTIYLNTELATQETMLVGERVTVEMRQGSNDFVRLPYDALDISSDGYYVWSVKSDKTVLKKEISIISNVRDAVIVQGELLPGEKVIISGKSGLKNGGKVEVDSEPELVLNHSKTTL